MRSTPRTNHPTNTSSASLLLVEEISHRIFNDYARAIASIQLAAKRILDPLASAEMIKTARLLQSHADLHRALLPPQCDDAVDLCNFLEQVCGAIVAASLGSLGVRLTLIQTQVYLPADRCWRMGLIVSELVTNAAKHGLDWNAGEIVVEVISQGDEICCRVSNDGAASATPGFGRGRHLVTMLTADLGGHVEWCFGDARADVLVWLPREQRPPADTRK
jgi:two-component sensor histidine kinase